jgi:TolA-binding protein
VRRRAPRAAFAAGAALALTGPAARLAAQAPGAGGAPNVEAAPNGGPAGPVATPLDSALARALDLEAAGRPREAAALFRRVLDAGPGAGRVAGRAGAPGGDESRVTALLGAERAYAELAQPDSVLPLVEPFVRARPGDALVRTVQLRTLVTLRRADEARAAYRAWRLAAPADPAPFREFARLLIAAGERAGADSVLADADRAGGVAGGARGRALAPERAQLLAGSGAWTAAAGAWRDALASGEPYEPAAVFSLQGAPDTARAGVAAALLAPPVVVPARRAAAQLLLAWRRPREAWAALAPLAPDSAARAAWRETAGQLAAAEAWGAARDAWARVFDTAPAGTESDAGRQAAAAAMAAGDAAGALALADRAAARASGADPELALVRVRALGRLGRAADAERAAAEAARAPGLDAADRTALAGAVADAWVAAGDLARARAALAAGGPAADSSAAAGWIALYAGDLRGARLLLRRTAASAAALPADDALASLTALTALSRTRAERAPALGAAFLALARGDSAGAAGGFEAAARALPDAAPPLLAAAARLRLARGDAPGAESLWRRIVAEHAQAPEAAEAELAWARALALRGDRPGARARFEHLIVTYPESALVPLARRELEALGGPG